MDAVVTERLILRPFRESDYDDLFEFLSQLADDEFEGYPGITYENGRKYLEERIRSEAYYAAELKETGKVIGNICLTDRPYDTKEAGYIINRLYRRRGYAYEALTALIRESFRQGTHRICAECDPRNVRSWKLAEKAGMKREAHFRKNIWFRKDAEGAPVWKDTYVYAVLKNDLSEIQDPYKQTL